MKEIEVKILGINKKLVIKKLRVLGAKLVFSGKMEALYFDDSKQSLKKQGKVLRLRNKGEVVEWTLKAMRKHRKIRVMDEFEMHIDSYKQAQLILKNLGYRVLKKVVKHRDSYQLGKDHFEIDKFPKIPAFLEIESPSEKQLQRRVQQLGFAMEDTSVWTTFDVLKHYQKKRK